MHMKPRRLARARALQPSASQAASRCAAGGRWRMMLAPDQGHLWALVSGGSTADSGDWRNSAFCGRFCLGGHPRSTSRYNTRGAGISPPAPGRNSAAPALAILTTTVPSFPRRAGRRQGAHSSTHRSRRHASNGTGGLPPCPMSAFGKSRICRHCPAASARQHLPAIS